LQEYRGDYSLHFFFPCGVKFLTSQHKVELLSFINRSLLDFRSYEQQREACTITASSIPKAFFFTKTIFSSSTINVCSKSHINITSVEEEAAK